MAGDTVRRAQHRGQALEAVAQSVGLTVGAARKAAWLASVYQSQERKQLGGALTRLTASHLEVAASAGRRRIELLQLAADECLPVRALREQVVRVAAMEPRGLEAVEVLGGRGELERTGAALTRYAAFTPRQLEQLLNGPNGDIVRQLAVAGTALSARLASAS
jgi:hypothetical protein